VYVICVGYWFPFEAAKALAAKFCYRIRYALTIIFGEDFPSLCLPEDHQDFGKYNIDPAIISRCQQRSDDQKRLESERRLKDETSWPEPTQGYVTPVESTPPRSIYQTSSPQTCGSTREHGRFFDPVRDNYIRGNDLSLELPSPTSGPWSVLRQEPQSYERNFSPTPHYSHMRFKELPLPFQLSNNRHHPYNSYTVGQINPVRLMNLSTAIERLTPIPILNPRERYPANEPFEISIANYPHNYQHHSLDSHSAPSSQMGPLFATLHVPLLARSVNDAEERGSKHASEPIPVIPESRDSPVPQDIHAAVEHDSKRRRVSGVLSPPIKYLTSHDELSVRKQLNSSSLFSSPRGVACEIPNLYPHIDFYGRITPAPLLQSLGLFKNDGESEKNEITQAAEGLLNLRRKDVRVDMCLRRRST
jgi:hypothetical protein